MKSKKYSRMNRICFKIAKLPAVGIFLCVCTTTIVSAQTNYSFTFPVNVPVPDGNASGLALTDDLTGLGGSITKLTLSLNISGGYNGDLYAYLRGPDGGFAVLLNRVGVTAGDAFGYSDTGFNITFDDSASYNNIHFYQNLSYELNGSGQLTGTWAADGRSIDPQSDPSVFDTTQPASLLDSFNGTNPNGTWTLFLTDLSDGGQSTVVNWGLNIEAVPEPSTYALLGIGFALFLARKKQIVERRKEPIPRMICPIHLTGHSPR
jgi:subtilisin-like proprotein convertase family protein